MLPEGDYIYEDLSSDFADTDQLLEELKEKKVTGYLKFENENEKGFTILERGVPGKMKIVRNSHEEIRNGDSLSEVLEEGSYTVEVVDCNESGREIVQIKLENEEIKSDISTGEVDISQFLSTNITDQENDCHIIMISGGDTGVITMSDGLPRQAKFSTSGEIMVGREALERILDYFETENVTIDIYRISKSEETGSEMGERMEEELEGMGEEFEEKADDLLDDMGLDFMGDEEEDVEVDAIQEDGEERDEELDSIKSESEDEDGSGSSIDDELEAVEEQFDSDSDEIIEDMDLEDE